jgi:hypothetical protein
MVQVRTGSGWVGIYHAAQKDYYVRTSTSTVPCIPGDIIYIQYEPAWLVYAGYQAGTVVPTRYIGPTRSHGTVGPRYRHYTNNCLYFSSRWTLKPYLHTKNLVAPQPNQQAGREPPTTTEQTDRPISPLALHFYHCAALTFNSTFICSNSRWFPRKRYVDDTGGGISCCPPEMVVFRRSRGVG